MLALYLAYLDDANDQRLFEDIYYSYRKQMVTLALSILGKKEDAEEQQSGESFHNHDACQQNPRHPLGCE